jgi:hypothetical protein
MHSRSFKLSSATLGTNGVLWSCPTHAYGHCGSVAVHFARGAPSTMIEQTSAPVYRTATHSALEQSEGFFHESISNLP